jgi:hypothetical protein
MHNILRSLIVLCVVFISSFADAAGAAAATPASASLLDDTPCVWRSLEPPYLDLHRELHAEVLAAPDYRPHNRAVVTLMILGGAGTEPVSIAHCHGRIIQSNHVYSPDGSIEISKKLTDGAFRKAKADGDLIAKLGKLMGDVEKALTGIDEEDETRAVRTHLLELTHAYPPALTALGAAQEAVLARKKETLERYKALEERYTAFYPFEERRKLLDSESSGCLLLEHFIATHETSSATAFHLHMHSDRPSCFYCVQLLNHRVKKLAKDTGKPWLVMVSSHANPDDADWCKWSGDLPPGHIVPGDTMREYGRDARHDAPLSAAEIATFTYTPDHPGKIIQMFFPSSPGTIAGTAAAAAAAATSERAEDEA